jgi:hypothetical protein
MRAEDLALSSDPAHLDCIDLRGRSEAEVDARVVAGEVAVGG